MLKSESLGTAEPTAANAETRASRSRLVAGTVDEVWETLAAFDQIGGWAKGVDHVSAASAVTQGPGAARRVKVGPITVVETVTVWEPRKRLEYSITGLPPLARHVTNSWQLQPAVGGTQVTLTSIVLPRSHIVGKLAAAALCRGLARVSDKLLAGLAEYHAARKSSSKLT